MAVQPFAAGSLADRIVLVDRGACNFTLKIKNIGDAGGLAGIIGLVAAGDPFPGGDGGDGPIDIPGYMISQADSTTLKDGLPDTVVRFDPETGIPLIGHMVGSSSRGLAMGSNIIKPEIGAPGASISAIAGSGTDEGPFGGTSGATPMVVGSAALLLQAYPNRTPGEIKAVLMNTGETDIMNQVAELGGYLAPISRIGGGEVRVDQAFAAPAAAWDDGFPQGALSFGFIDVNKNTVNLHKKVRVRNYSDYDIEYTIVPTFRYADDEATGAVSVHTPQKVKVKAGKDATFPVKLTINGALLWDNWMNSGSEGANPDALTINEYDGYLILDDGSHPIHLAWHVLPRKAANVVGRTNLTLQRRPDVVALTNNGVGAAQNDAYSLLAISPDQPEGGLGEQSPTPDIRAVGINTFPVPAGYCLDEPSFVWAFAVNTWERQSHLLPVNHYFYLDTDRDGVDDYAVLNSDASGPGGTSDGRQFSWAVESIDRECGRLVLCRARHQHWKHSVVHLRRADWPDRHRYAGDQRGPGRLRPRLLLRRTWRPGRRLDGDTAGRAILWHTRGHRRKIRGGDEVVNFGPFPGNSPELGVMLITNGDRGSGARGGATQDTEALLFMAP